LSGRGLCGELITRPEESYRLCCVVVCDLETSRMGAPYIYDISHLRVKEYAEAIKCTDTSRYALHIMNSSYKYRNINRTVEIIQNNQNVA